MSKSAGRQRKRGLLLRKEVLKDLSPRRLQKALGGVLSVEPDGKPGEGDGSDGLSASK